MILKLWQNDFPHTHIFLVYAKIKVKKPYTENQVLEIQGPEILTKFNFF